MVALNTVEGMEHMGSMMQLTRLMETYSKVLDWAGDRVKVHGAVADLRQVQPGCLFVAIPRTGVEDCSMIKEALKGGTLAVVANSHQRS